jgi:hypothetical protein
MRKFWLPSLVLGLFLAANVRAQDEVLPILEKAIKAHGGVAKLEQQNAVHTKAKGTIDLLGGIEFTQEVKVYAGKLKDMMQMTVMGQNVNVQTVYDGKQAWVVANGQTIDLGDKLLEEFKSIGYQTRVAKLVPLKDKEFQLSPLGESQVEAKPAVGIKVQSKGHKDINLYFDKASGLLVKLERHAIDATSMQEVMEERIMLEYQEQDGYKVPKKLLINRDGKKFIEAEILEMKILDKIDENEFAKP